MYTKEQLEKLEQLLKYRAELEEDIEYLSNATSNSIIHNNMNNE